jgi:penicillin amidase
VVKKVLFFSVVLVALVGAAGWWWARASLPILDGQLTLPGLQAPVEVLIDGYGVPTVYAADTADVWFVAGALHARERLWQMELYRRVTLGRLSEIFGERTLPIDRRFLTLRLRAAAEAEWQRANPAVRTALERYSAGVNQVAAAMIGRQRPLEFQLLRVTPAPWTPVDSLAVGWLLAWRLAENHQAELVRGVLAERFGEEKAQQLAGKYPASAPTVISNPAPDTQSSFVPKVPIVPTVPGSVLRVPSAASALAPTPLAPLARLAPLAPIPGLEWLSADARRGLSNNWVVSGRKTKSGRAMLANDPHLQIEFPSVWYEMHLVSADLDVAGVSIPGTPFIVLGHNGRVAWGLTNTGADVQDLYLERIDVARQRVMANGQWMAAEVTPVEIPVRGRATADKFEVWKTRHGPVFSDVGLNWDGPPSWLSPQGRSGDEKRAYALRWDMGGDLAASIESLNRSTGWPSVLNAIRTFSVPSVNLVYADIDGNIGYAMAGRVPIRSSGDGTLPVNGNNGESEWSGSIDSDSLPRVYNPTAGYITSSNNEIDRGFPGLITRDWAAPFRTTRLHGLLAAGKDLDLGSMVALQNDRHSVAADLVLADIDATITSLKQRNADKPSVAALERLATWDHVVDARPIVSFYEAFEDAVWRRTFQDEMDEPLFLKFYEWAGAERPSGLYAIIGDRESPWFDDIGTVEKRESRDDVYLLAARDAEERLQREWGGEGKRAWDVVHSASFDHPLAAGALPLKWLFSRGPVPVSGDGTTVMRISWNRLKPFAAWEYPSWRQIFDVGAWDQSRVVLPTGQSGHPLSPYYFDQNSLWREGRYRTQPFSREAVQAATQHRLLFVP